MSDLNNMQKDNSDIVVNDKMVDAAIKKALTMKLDPKEILVMAQLLSPNSKEETILAKIKDFS
jgi:ribosomal protein L4